MTIKTIRTVDDILDRAVAVIPEYGGPLEGPG